MLDTSTLPTHIACVVRRLQVVGPLASADTFLMTSYVIESFFKSMVLSLIAGVRRGSSGLTQRIEYEIVRADGLGTWEKVIGDFTGQSQAGYLDSDLQPLIVWLTKKRTHPDDAWARTAIERCVDILAMLGVAENEVPQRPNVRFLLSQLVRIRNKTKAHGAVGPDFFDKANPLFISAAQLLLEHSPLCQWEWYHLSIRPDKNNTRAIRLYGITLACYPNLDPGDMRIPTARRARRILDVGTTT